MLKFLNSVFVRFVEIVLVVGAVVVFAFFDPFNIFSTRTKLKDTPVSVESIREIGQLITAEYYGEVVSSLSEEIEVEVQGEASVLRENVSEYHDDFLGAIEELQEEDLNTKKGKRITDYFEREYPELANHELYDRYLYYLRIQIEEDTPTFTKEQYGETLSRRQRRRFFRNLYTKRDEARYQNLDRVQLNDFISAFEEDTLEEREKKFKKSRLVILGRGWVKAGFDFGEFSQRNFVYDDTRRIVHFVGMRPEIISATINPWFIPEKGVEGFEIMIASGRAERDHELMRRVKQICLDKLRQQAMDRDILGRAKINAQDNMKAFFSLLIEGEEIRDVLFHSNVFDYTLNTLLEDDALRDAELLVLDSTLLRSVDDPVIHPDQSFESRSAFLDSLSVHPIELFEESHPGPLSRFTRLVFEFGEDEILSEFEQDTLYTMIGTLQNYETLDSLWTRQQPSDSLSNETIRNTYLDFKSEQFNRIATEALRVRIQSIEEAAIVMLADTLQQSPDTLAQSDTTLQTGTPPQIDSVAVRVVYINSDTSAVNAWFTAFSDSLNNALTSQ